MTLSDIADQVGLSRDTVSRIVNRDATYQKPALARRAERVRQVAEQLGYRPNAAARAARSGRFGAVALIQPSSGAQYLPDDLLMALVRSLSAQKTHLIVAEIETAALGDEARLPRVLRELTSDGILINQISDIPSSLTRLVATARCAAVWLNSQQQADCVRPDDEAAVEAVARQMIERGHRRLALLFSQERPSRRHYSRSHREAAFRAVSQEAGLAVQVGAVAATADTDPAEAFARVRDLLRAADRPTGILVTQAESARIVAMAARDLGLRLPEDLSLGCVGDAGPWVFGMPVTYAAADWTRVGELAGAAIREKIEHPGRRRQPLVVPPRFHEGGSIVPPPSS